MTMMMLESKVYKQRVRVLLTANWHDLFPAFLFFY
jgi:hypothetical protein